MNPTQQPSLLPVLKVADWFLARGIQENRPITAMKLQKLVFYANCWCLAVMDRPLVDEVAIAYEYGPIFPTIRLKTIEFGQLPITNTMEHWIWLGLQSNHYSGDSVPLLEKIWSNYGCFTDSQLSRLVMTDGEPCLEARKRDPWGRNVAIDDELIRPIFIAKYKNQKQATPNA